MKLVVSATENKPKTEADLLLDYLAKTGDYVNSRQFPSMIKAPTVLENLNKKMLVIDIRTAEIFKKGHIKGAVNVEFSKLPDYFVKGIKPFQFDKIVLVCQHGQKSGYATALASPDGIWQCIFNAVGNVGLEYCTCRE